MRLPAYFRLSALGLAALFLPQGARSQTADEGRYVSAAQLAAMVAAPDANTGLKTVPVPAGPGATILAARRDRMGEVEVHDGQNDEFVVQSGSATVRVGGKVSGNHQTAPGEWRGGTITGGKDYHLAPGDVLWIPAGAPHQTTPQGGVFRYLAFKFPTKP